MHFKIPRVEKKLKILMIAPQPWFQPRGTPFSVLHRIKALTLLGHSVDLVTYHIGQDVPMDNLRIFRAAPIPGVHKVKIGPSKTKVLLDIALYRKAVQVLKSNEYDLLHTHEEASFFAGRLAKRFNLPHLYDMHSSLPQQLDNFKFTRSRLLKNIFDHLETSAVTQASALITICPELQSYVEEKFPDKSSLLIENVADNSLVFPPSGEGQAAGRKRYNLDGKRVVLYYGTLEPYQGIDMFIDSARYIVGQRNGDVRFLLVGGDADQVRKYQLKINKAGLSDHFVLTGFVQPQQIPTMVSLADVLVSPRLKGTNSPLKIYSYLRSGKPIVATRHITHTQILNERVSVLTEPEPRDFAAGILSILEDEEKQQKLTRAAQQLAEEKYSYNSYLAKTQLIVEKATGAVR